MPLLHSKHQTISLLISVVPPNWPQDQGKMTLPLPLFPLRAREGLPSGLRLPRDLLLQKLGQLWLNLQGLHHQLAVIHLLETMMEGVLLTSAHSTLSLKGCS